MSATIRTWTLGFALLAAGGVASAAEPAQTGSSKTGKAGQDNRQRESGTGKTPNGDYDRTGKGSGSMGAAEEKAAADGAMVQGEIVRVDAGENQITIRTLEGEKTFKVSPRAKVNREGKPVQLSALKNGDMVSATFVTGAAQSETLAVLSAESPR